MGSYVRAAGDTGSTRIWTAQDGALRLETREQGVPPAPALADTKVLNLVPASAEAFDVDATITFADLVAGTMFQFEDRLASRTLRDDFAGREDTPLQRFEQGWYANFEKFREVVTDKLGEHFEAPGAWLIGTEGKVSKFDLVVRQKGAGANARPFQMRGRDLPTLELAVIGKPKDEARATALMEELYGALLEGVFESAGAGEAKVEKPLRREDLGLGVPTWAWDGSWLGKATGGAAALTAEGDLRAHHFFVNGYLVFSTSPGLSKKIVAAAKGQSPAVKPQDVRVAGDGGGAAPGSKVIAVGRFDGSVLSKYLRHVGQWVAVAARATGEAEGKPGEITRLVEVFDGLGELCDLMERAQWVATQGQAGDQQLRASLTFTGR
jgi:hypothetical protein